MSFSIVSNLLRCCCLLFFLVPCDADVDAGTDTLLQGQALRVGEYLSSANKLFRLQFYSPASSGFENSNKCLCIFQTTKTFEFNKDPVWVANRDAPVPDLFVELKIDTGVLKIYYRGGNVSVSNFPTNALVVNASATILDNGNLVLRAVNRDGSTGDRVLWQSFDYPTNTLLPGMKLGINFMTGHKWSLTSWISEQVPASGTFTLGGDPNGSSQLILWWQGDVYWTSGLWENDHFNDTSDAWLNNMRDINLSYVQNDREKYLTLSGFSNDIKFAKLTVGLNGAFTVHKEFGNSTYAAFFASGCSVSYFPCDTEKLPECRKVNTKFYPRQVFVMPNSRGYWRKNNLSLYDCDAKCLPNCSCIAYSSLYSNGTGCEIFDDKLSFQPVDSEHTGFPSNQARVVYFPNVTHPGETLKTRPAKKWWIGVIAGIGALLLLTTICFITAWKRLRGNNDTIEEISLHELEDASELATPSNGVIDEISKKMMNTKHVQVFSFGSLEMATNNFSITNKLGEGGFGSVYKGRLIGGQEIAMKRLSRSSGQGLSEFQNEILLIAELQHDNLVKLLGCCTKGQEKILVYEYMPNKSLDFFLFDANKRELLKWTDRMNIIEGVAQGLLYLHRFSRLKVIHRDLKASNILLDQNMNPKISDFGMARIFGKQESEVNTNKIVGTYGYMSPEYAMKGVFSTKTDVFSFGVLLLEIVSGKRNYGSYNSQRPLNLIGLAWEFWVEGRAMEFLDSKLDGSNHENKMIRCVNIGLLCVQDEASDRPSMTGVISMLTNESTQLPKPKQPAFFIDINSHDASNENSIKNPSTNGLTISTIEGR